MIISSSRPLRIRVGERLPASRPSRQLPRGAPRDGGADAGLGAPRHPGRQRRPGLQAFL